jgi:hypothetical protein
VTSATFSANFAQGAVDAQVVADAKCADAVATASRQYPGAFHGKWLAWLTTSTAAASIHVPGVAGGTFFEWSLVGRAWTSTPHVFDADLKLAGNEVLSRSELGEELPIVDVWTGSPQGGNVYETDTCHDWTSLGNLSGTIQGTIGQTHQMAGLWTNYTTVGCGSNPKHLYCFQVEK